MKVYLKCGICKENVPDLQRFVIPQNFCIQCYEENGEIKFFYPNEKLIYKALDDLVLVYDLLENIYFPDKELYEKESYALPIEIASGGFNSDNAISKTTLQQFVQEIRTDALCKTALPDLNKMIYLNDCQYIVSAIQNTLEDLDNCFIDFYVYLSTVDSTAIQFSEDGIHVAMSRVGRKCSFCIENYFAKMNAVLDLFCKLMYEIEKPQEDFSTIPRLRGNNKAYGQAKYLKIWKTPGTLFEKDEFIRMILSIRNHVIHNGSLEMNPKVFIVKNEGNIVERYLLVPDIENDHLVQWENRNQFYSTETKWNDFFPKIHREFLERTLKTIKYILGDKLTDDFM